MNWLKQPKVFFTVAWLMLNLRENHLKFLAPELLVCSKRSLSVLMSAVERCHTTQTALALARQPSSEIIHILVPCIVAVAVYFTQSS